MNEIYNKINNHQYLNRDDILNFINSLSNGTIKTIFLDNLNSVAAYQPSNSTICVLKKIKSRNLKYLINFSILKFKQIELFEEPNFLVDLYNLYLLSILFHELEHAIQYKKVSNSLSPKTRLINDSIKFSSQNIKIYNKNHDLYYLEYDAMIKCLNKTLMFIEKGLLNLNKKSISEFNRIIASIIYHSYGNSYKDGDETKIYDKFVSPMSYLNFLSYNWNTEEENERVSSDIKTLKQISTNEYIKLVNGFKVSDDTLDLIYYICCKNYITDNLFNEVKKISKIKNK